MGQTPFLLPKTEPKILWRFQTKGPIFSSPALDGDGHLYVGSLDGFLYSVFADSGKLRWKQKVGGRIFASPTITPKGIAIGGDNDRLVLVRASDGKIQWSYQLGPCPRAPGLGPDSVKCDADSSPLQGSKHDLYFGGDSLYALDLADGTLVWRLKLANHAFSSPARGSNGVIYIGTQANTMIAVTASGEQQWEFKAKGDCDTTPALLNSKTLVFGCDDGWFYALSTDSGQQLWATHVFRPIRSSPAISPKGSIHFGTDSGRLYTLAVDGRKLWHFNTGGAIRSSPVVDPEGTMAFGSQDNYLYVLSAKGALLWKAQLGGDIDSSVAVGPSGAMYVGTDDGFLYALR